MEESRLIYYKILKDGIVIDANNVFLRWQARHNTLMVCRPEDGQFIQSSDQSEVYRVNWLHRAPEDIANQYMIVDAREINEEEYLRVRAILNEGEQPEEVQPENEPEELPQKQGQVERILSVDEMRRAFAEIMRKRAEREENLVSDAVGNKYRQEIGLDGGIRLIMVESYTGELYE